jgi:CRP-like cAMP-binding protein
MVSFDRPHLRIDALTSLFISPYITTISTIRLGHFSVAVSLLSETTEDRISENQNAIGLTARTLDDVLVECVDQGLQRLIGRKATEAIYDHLERNYSLKREDIPKKLDTFTKLTKSIFGEKGSGTVERRIAKLLWENLGWRFQAIQGLELIDYVNLARERIARELVQKAKRNVRKNGM